MSKISTKQRYITLKNWLTTVRPVKVNKRKNRKTVKK